jgi:hypothetical protein
MAAMSNKRLQTCSIDPGCEIVTTTTTTTTTTDDAMVGIGLAWASAGFAMCD